MERHIGMISCKIEELKNNKNLEELIGQHNKIKDDIVKAQQYLTSIKKKIKIEKDVNPCYVSEEELQQLYEESINAETLEEQIKKYNVLCTRIEQCEKYLNNKKLEIIKIE